ncbi:MAG: MBL fold metallo-hydrolase [Ignavibacteria bacterium RBG_13_36_8]|nr:MAG: MBL fold metallo-hydrolase [Ignavibacteria bacterium RBG_13_36_8]
MITKQFLTGGDRNFGYLIADEKTKLAVIIDPSYSPEMICGFAKDNDYEIKYILNTHDHYDHTNGNTIAEKLTGTRALTFGDTDPFTGQEISDGVILPLGELQIKIIHTPGHTMDSICIYIGDAVFTGDTLFVGKVGGTGYGKDAEQEYNSLHNKLMKLPDSTRVFPGHNVGTAPESTIENERKTNPFFLQPNFEAFIELKKNWTEYKRKHGID